MALGGPVNEDTQNKVVVYTIGNHRYASTIVYTVDADGKKASVAYDVMSDTGSSFSAVKSLLTKYSVDTAQKMFKAWQELEITMTVKFIDGNVKAQNPDGSFKHTEFSAGCPDGLTQPGYTDTWKEAVVHFHGDVIEEKPMETK